MADKLTEFLRAHQVPQPDPQLRSEWLAAVEQLYGEMRTWLGEAKADGLADIKDADTTITEERLGTYEVPVLQLFFGGRMVVVRPVGRLILGAKGRVDMSLGPRKFILIWEGDGRWKIAQVAGKDASPLTKDTFSAAVEQLLS